MNFKGISHSFSPETTRTIRCWSDRIYIHRVNRFISETEPLGSRQMGCSVCKSSVRLSKGSLEEEKDLLEFRSIERPPRFLAAVSFLRVPLSIVRENFAFLRSNVEQCSICKPKIPPTVLCGLGYRNLTLGSSWRARSNII